MIGYRLRVLLLDNYNDRIQVRVAAPGQRYRDRIQVMGAAPGQLQ